MSKSNSKNNSPVTETITIDGYTVVLKYAQESNAAVLKNIREILFSPRKKLLGLIKNYEDITSFALRWL